VQTAYKAVMKPKEGTILTVSRVASEKAVLFAKENQAVEAVLEEAIKAANEALANTVNQNPVLLKAGVIDAGGYGFCIILEGMLRSLRGEKPQEVSETVEATRESADFTEYKTEDIKFAYCTEFIVERSNKKDASKLRAFLGSIGDSLVLVDDDEIIKVHVHTNHPGRAIEEGLKYGSLVTTKIENMKLQHEDKLFESEKPQGREIAAPEQKYGFIAVAAGDGLSELFGQLGTNHVIEGGQTMNPSTEDILGKIDKTPSEIVFVLPNNKNIIMAAEQCVGLSEKQVVVLPTKSIPEGVAAILAFDMTAELEENREEMLKAVSRVRTGQVTYAARNSDFDGHKINKGDYLALSGGKLLANGKNKNAIMKKLARDLNRDETSLVTIFYGEGVTEDEANEVSEIIKKEMKGVEVSVVYGGQPVYYYLISAE